MQSTKRIGVFVLVLAGLSAIAYLSLAFRLGYYNDDWYLMYDVRTQGAQFFHEIFSSDRPGRAFFMIPLYSLLGSNPLYYNITAYLFRLLGGLMLFWTLRIVWPKKYFLPAVASVLFTIYPGFLSQPNAIDYQSHIAALALALLSVALTVKSITASRRGPRLFLIFASILTGWACLSQMEYFIGVEAFRLGCVFVLLWREPYIQLSQKIKNVAFNYLPFLAIPGGFLFWHLFLFQPERRATDIGFQLGQLFTSPLTGLWSLVYLIQDTLNVLFVAWGSPLSLFAFQLRLRERYIALGLAILAVLLVIWLSRWIERSEIEEENNQTDRTSHHEIFWLGLFTIVGGLVPVILANRHIVFPDYSRYTLVASIGAVLVLTTILENIRDRYLRIGLVSMFVMVAVLTHYGNSVRAAAETSAVHNFWWQVAWRAPSITPGTTLIGNYAVGGIQEDYFVWGPANLIYHTEKQNVVPIHIKLPAAVLTDDVVLKVLAGKGVETPLRRGNELIRDFSNVLVISQASENSCVHIIDGKQPDLSVFERQSIMLVAPSSTISNVSLEGNSPVPPAEIFGDEPTHDWCFYYQKADLARQSRDWAKVASLGDEAQKLGLHPNDQVEWMPFLQAYAYLGDQKQVKGISTRINTEVFYKQQACSRLNGMADYGYPLSAEMQDRVNELFCK